MPAEKKRVTCVACKTSITAKHLRRHNKTFKHLKNIATFANTENVTSSLPLIVEQICNMKKYVLNLMQNVYLEIENQSQVNNSLCTTEQCLRNFLGNLDQQLDQLHRVQNRTSMLKIENSERNVIFERHVDEQLMQQANDYACSNLSSAQTNNSHIANITSTESTPGILGDQCEKDVVKIERE